MRQKAGRTGRSFGSVTPYLDLGLRFALSMLISVYAGYWLDSKLSTSPLFLLLGTVLGAVAGFLPIYRAAFPQKKNDEDQNGTDGN